MPDGLLACFQDCLAWLNSQVEAGQFLMSHFVHKTIDNHNECFFHIALLILNRSLRHSCPNPVPLQTNPQKHRSSKFFCVPNFFASLKPI